MDEIAKEAGISKGTVYFYYDTKENLYMALTYRAILLLNDIFYRVVDVHSAEKGLESSLALLDNYLTFCEEHPLYADLMLDYMRVNRSESDRNKLTTALRSSIFYRKIQDIQNIPIGLITREIQRGIDDGSIKNQKRPELLYLLAWSATIGFVKLNIAAGGSTSLLNVDVAEWRSQLKRQLRAMLLLEDF